MFYLASAEQDFHAKYWLPFLMGPGSLQQEAVSTGCPQPVHPAGLLVACCHGLWQRSPALPRGSRGVPAPVGSTGQARPGAHGLGWAEGHMHLVHTGCFTDWAMLGHTERIGLPEYGRFVLSMFFMFIPTPETWDCHQDLCWSRLNLSGYIFFFLVKSSKYWDQRKVKLFENVCLLGPKSFCPFNLSAPDLVEGGLFLSWLHTSDPWLLTQGFKGLGSWNDNNFLSLWVFFHKRHNTGGCLNRALLIESNSQNFMGDYSSI